MQVLEIQIVQKCLSLAYTVDLLELVISIIAHFFSIRILTCIACSLCRQYFKLSTSLTTLCSSCSCLDQTFHFDVELRLSPRWVGGNIGSTDATKTYHNLNAYIFEINNRKVINNASLDSL
jgi:hypothetical protein